MKSQRIFHIAEIFLVLCVISSRTERLFQVDANRINQFINSKSDQEWNNENPRHFQVQKIFKREPEISERNINANKTSCSRYCIEEKDFPKITRNDSVKRIKIIWKIVEDSRIIFNNEPSVYEGITRSIAEDQNLRRQFSKIPFDKIQHFYEDETNCELYLNLGCETYSKLNTSTLQVPNKFFNLDQRKLVSMEIAGGYSEADFNVDQFIEELGIFAVGKISQAVLEIPIESRTGYYEDTMRPRPTLSLSHTNDARGLQIVARNPPLGQWRLKFLGVGNSNYNFSVIAVLPRNLQQDSISSKDRKIVKSFINDKPILRVQEKPTETLLTPERFDYLRSIDENNAMQAIISIDEQPQHHLPAEPDVTVPNRMPFVRSKFPRRANFEAEMMEPGVIEKMTSGISTGEDDEEKAQVVEDTELNELSRATEEIQTRIKKTIVDLSPITNLIARPDTFHDVVFTVTNNQALGIRHSFQGRSTQFPVIQVIPPVSWIRTGESVNVAIRIQVPNVEDTVPNTVTLYVGGSENFEVVEKSTYIYVQGTGVTATDNDKPSIDYMFNDNCAGKLNRDRCSRSRWSVEITVNDPDSGLKRVTSLPNGVEPRTEFIAGTKNSVNFYYISTCCYTTVDVTAIDVQGNTYTRTIDVTEWNNLNQGEIAAIVVGALLILLLIILIILILIYCIRKRKSHDLPYSQRYGSRAPASTERTNF